MTVPRIVLEGDVVFVSARCVQRLSLLTPDPRITAGIRYFLAHYAEKHGIELFAACAMSSHLHLVYQDPHARGPHFLRDFHRAVALLVHEVHGWRGAVFENRPTQVRLLTPESIIDKIAYTLANPVEAGGVARASSWPGVWTGLSAPPSSVVPRPRTLPKHSRLPPVARLQVGIPRALGGTQTDSARAQLQAALDRAERRNRRRVATSRGRFRDPQECARRSIKTRSTSRETKEFTSEFSALGWSDDRRREVRAAYRAFRMRYAASLMRFRAGETECVFPSGTFNMRWLAGVACEPALALSHHDAAGFGEWNPAGARTTSPHTSVDTAPPASHQN